MAARSKKELAALVKRFQERMKERRGQEQSERPRDQHAVLGPKIITPWRIGF